MSPDEDELPDDQGSENEDPPAGDNAEKFVPPKDGSWVPRARLDEAVGKHASRADALAAELQREREERIRLEERERLRSTPPAPKITRAQLHELVREGKITEEQADAEYEKQLQERIRSEVLRDSDAKQRIKDRSNTINALLAQYKESIPDIATPGTEARSKVESEYRYLVDVLGEPEGIETEAKACRSAFGPPERAKELTRRRRDTHQESGGGSGSGDAPDKNKKLPERIRTHYEKLIRIGRFKGWDDPGLKAELEYVSSRAK
jgi:hypothetical protein